MTAFSESETILGSFHRFRIQAILPEIQRQQKTKKDFIVPASKLAVDASGRLILTGVRSFKLEKTGDTFLTFEEADRAAGTGDTAQTIIPQEAEGDLALNATAERQLCQKTGVPLDFIKKLRNEGQPLLAMDILNHRLVAPRLGTDCQKPEELPNSGNADRYMVRTLDGKVRAVLSDRYRIIDNMDLFFAAADKLHKVGGEIWQMRLSDNRFEMTAVSRAIAGEVRRDRPFEGWTPPPNGGPDTQYAAITINNSETGGGSASVAPAVFTKWCSNLCIFGKTLRAVHIGRTREDDGELTDSAEVQAAESRLVWLRLQEAIEKVFDAEKFAAYIERLNGATQRIIPRDNVPKLIENLANRYEIPEDRAAAIMANLMESRDYSQYGLTQAITLRAHAEDKAGEADLAAELEAVGGELVRLPQGEFAALAGTA